LSAHDVILSVDGLKLTRTDEWIKMLDKGTTLKTRSPEFLEGSHRYATASYGKGYCVPNSWMDASKNLWQISDKLPCPDELIAFEKMNSNGSMIFPGKIDRDSGQKEIEGKYCLIAKDVVKLRKCGNVWQGTKNDGSSCTCFQVSSCTEEKNYFLPALRAICLYDLSTVLDTIYLTNTDRMSTVWYLF
jgi:S2P endopeptidase